MSEAIFRWGSCGGDGDPIEVIGSRRRVGNDILYRPNVVEVDVGGGMLTPEHNHLVRGGIVDSGRLATSAGAISIPFLRRGGQSKESGQ